MHGVCEQARLVEGTTVVPAYRSSRSVRATMLSPFAGTSVAMVTVAKPSTPGGGEAAKGGMAGAGATGGASVRVGKHPFEARATVASPATKRSLALRGDARERAVVDRSEQDGNAGPEIGLWTQHI